MRFTPPSQAMNSSGNRTVRIAVGARRFSPLGPVPRSYLRSLERAGAAPVVLLPDCQGPTELMSCSGLLLTGGGDVARELYGNSGDGGQAADRLRDDAELQLLEQARDRDLPVLAICHGMQLLNVAHGGTLAPLAPPALAGRHGTPEAWTQHPVALRAGSRTAAAFDATVLDACSSHHQQGLGRLGEGLDAVGRSDDGVVEAIEDPRASWTVGVLWHPEDTAPDDPAQRRVFAAFADAAREAAAR
jgi:putative glutamine amidotransferase